MKQILSVLLLFFSALAYGDTLRVGILESSLMGYKDNQGQLKGFEAELAQQVCQRMQRNCRFVLQPFKKNLSDIRQGKLDLAFSSILVTPERQKQIIFSKRYMRSVSSFVGNPEKQPRYRPIKVAVVRNSIQEHYLRQKHSAGMDVYPFDNLDDVYSALASGDVDRVLLPAILQLAFLNQQDSGHFDLIGEPLDNNKLGGDVSVAIHPDRPELQPDVDQAINQLLTDGSYNQLNKKYLPFNIY